MKDLDDIQKRAHADSQFWFPAIHRSTETAVVHFSLGIAGEVGELVNLVKKANRHPAGLTDSLILDHYAEVRAEAADVAIYLLDICEELGFSLADAIEEKRGELIRRWGDPDEIPEDPS